MKKILVPTDFSDYSYNALDLGIQLARKLEASIILIHIVESSTAQTFNTVAMTGLNDMGKVFHDEMQDKGRKELDILYEKLNIHDIEIDRLLITCNPFDSIAEIISKQKVDLIVMGTKGCSGLNEMIIGSNTEKVVRLASAPVITVPSKVDLDKFKKMVFASNLSIDKQIAGVVINFQQLLNTEIELLWVHTPHVIENEERVIEKLKDDIKKFEIRNCSINVRKNISVEGGILAFAEEIEADLILMATHGRQGLMHLIGGSFTEEIVNHSPRPVLTLSLNS